MSGIQNMLSYQHGYHAGNFADVVKHLTLSRIIDYLIQKDKPLLFIDTHSGRGLYDFKDGQALKTNEFQQGILPLWNERKTLSPLFSPYIDTLKHLNPNHELRYYSGSPYLAASLLRSIDRICCYERHSKEHSFLVENVAPQKRLSLIHGDGLSGLAALLPPIERRGLIFVDPSYEVKTDYKDIPATLHSAYNRFSTGTYCIWYPIIDSYIRDQYVRRLVTIAPRDSLQIEFMLGNKLPGMKGCGMWIINPPFKLAEEMTIICKSLVRLLNPGASSYSIRTSDFVSVR